MDCVSEDLKHHHKKVQIKDELQKWMSQWQLSVENYKHLKQIIDNNYSAHKPLVSYLDQENLLKVDYAVRQPIHNISYDVEQFEQEFYKIISMMKEVETFFENKDISQISVKINVLI